MLVLISGVVLLTHKKPEPPLAAPSSAATVPILRGALPGEDGGVEGVTGGEGRDVEELWAIGDDSDEEDGSGRNPSHREGRVGNGAGRGPGRGEERVGLIGSLGDVQRRPGGSNAVDPFRDEGDEFGDWEDAGGKAGLLR
jgi:hypothetical protein